MQVARHRIPLCTEVLGVTAAEVLRCADILGRREGSEKVVVRRAIERSFAIDSSFANYAWFVNVKILEGVVRHAIGEKIAVTMTIGATGTTGRDFIAEELFAPRNLG